MEGRKMEWLEGGISGTREQGKVGRRNRVRESRVREGVKGLYSCSPDVLIDV